MLTRMKRALAILVTLLVCAAPCQTAVCQLACGLKSHPSHCHAAANSTDATDMGADCAQMANPAKQRFDFNLPDPTCQHLSAWAFQKSEPAEFPLTQANHSALVAGSVAAALPRHDQGATKSPPILFSFKDPLLTSLRI